MDADMATGKSCEKRHIKNSSQVPPPKRSKVRSSNKDKEQALANINNCQYAVVDNVSDSGVSLNMKRSTSVSYAPQLNSTESQRVAFDELPPQPTSQNSIDVAATKMVTIEYSERLQLQNGHTESPRTKSIKEFHTSEAKDAYNSETSTSAVSHTRAIVAITWFEMLRALLVLFGASYVLMTPAVMNFETIEDQLDLNDHLIPPTHTKTPIRAKVTLREFLLQKEGIHLGMAPAFFGYYGYFGSLAAWDDELSNSTFALLKENIKSVAGASAGAMAAVLLASGISPRKAAEFCSSISLRDFADFPGLLTVFKGNKFEEIMHTFMATQNPDSSLKLEDSPIPVAVSGFDLLTMQGKVLTRGSMARAARASACFPFLFQPVGWIDNNENYLFTDGGITDMAGLNGLGAFQHHSNLKKRVVNLIVGEYQFGVIPGPSSMPPGINASEVVSISIRGLPQCGPHAMDKGPLAVQGAQLAMKKALDLPMYFGEEAGHYILHIDASPFVPT